jgi:hypothetical protein
MGLADFLAQAGQHTAIGQVAQAFGGRTTNQQAVDDFINNQLPALADQIHKAGTKDDVAKAGQSLITGGLKAGINPQGLEKLMEMTIKPALQNLNTGELDKLRADYGAQPAQPAESRPPGTEGPLTPSGNFIDPKAATPEKPLDLNFMMRLGQATGAKPEEFNKMLETPATIAGKQASNLKTQGEIDKETAKEKAIQGLSSTPAEPGQPSLQATARINPGGIQQFLPVRQDEGKQDYQNQLLGLKQQGLDNALSMAQMRIGAANDRAAGAESRAGFNHEAELRKEFQGQSKNFQQIRDSYNRIMNAADTPAGAIVALMSFSKAMDPGARVTDQDFKTVQSARPFLERLGISPDAVKSLWEGSKMTPGMWRDIKGRTQGLYDAEAQQHQKRVGEYSRVAKESGLNPSRVITDMEATGEAPAAPAGQGGYSQRPSGSGSGAATGQGAGAPPVGTVSKGYRFKGGNPADRNSWEKVQ